MQIVIDIDENDYGDAKMRVLLCGSEMCESLNGRYAYAIANGTPLPEHHGDLIDRNEINIPYDICDGDEAMCYVNEVSPIIEADTEGSDSE